MAINQKNEKKNKQKETSRRRTFKMLMRDKFFAKRMLIVHISETKNFDLADLKMNIFITLSFYCCRHVCKKINFFYFKYQQ